MTDNQEPTEGSVEVAQTSSLDIMDFGDATTETKQRAPVFLHADCVYGVGARPGC